MLPNHKCKNVYKHVCSPDTSMSSADCTIKPLILEHTLSWSHLPAHYKVICFFVSPATHYCWVFRGRMEWEVGLTLIHMTSGEKSNPRPFDLEPNDHSASSQLCCVHHHLYVLNSLKVRVTTIDALGHFKNRIITAQWEEMGRCRVGEVRAGTTSPMPDHKGFKLQ